MKEQIKVVAQDIWIDQFPIGDVYLLGDVFHDWSQEKCVLLVKKWYDRLPPNEQIILHEMVFDENKTVPS